MQGESLPDKRGRHNKIGHRLDSDIPPNQHNNAQCFKTKMCAFNLKGQCTRENCSFAHSNCEIRVAPDLTKTKVCTNWKLGSCQHGDACRFAHGAHDLRQHPDRCNSSRSTRGNNNSSNGNTQRRFTRTSSYCQDGAQGSTQAPINSGLDSGSGQSGPHVQGRDRVQFVGSKRCEEFVNKFHYRRNSNGNTSRDDMSNNFAEGQNISVRGLHVHNQRRHSHSMATRTMAYGRNHTTGLAEIGRRDDNININITPLMVPIDASSTVRQSPRANSFIPHTGGAHQGLLWEVQSPPSTVPMGPESRCQSAGSEPSDPLGDYGTDATSTSCPRSPSARSMCSTHDVPGGVRPIMVDPFGGAGEPPYGGMRCSLTRGNSGLRPSTTPYEAIRMPQQFLCTGCAGSICTNPQCFATWPQTPAYPYHPSYRLNPNHNPNQVGNPNPLGIDVEVAGPGSLPLPLADSPPSTTIKAITEWVNSSGPRAVQLLEEACPGVYYE